MRPRDGIHSHSRLGKARVVHTFAAIRDEMRVGIQIDGARAWAAVDPQGAPRFFQGRWLKKRHELKFGVGRNYFHLLILGYNLAGCRGTNKQLRPC